MEPMDIEDDYISLRSSPAPEVCIVEDFAKGKSLRYIFNHLVLPPKVPQSQDDDLRERDVDLLDFLVDAASRYSPALGSKEQWSHIDKALRTMRRLRESVDSTSLGESFGDFGNNDIIPLYVEAQNAGLIMSWQNNGVIFQSFEAAISNEAIMTCPDRLICTFPGPSLCVPLDVAADSDFQKHLSIFLEQMDTNSLDPAQVLAYKGGATHQETREPPDPMHITDLLSNILLGFSTIHDAPRFTKRVRDEVNLASGRLPWRRSPMWLVARVSLQLSLTEEHEDRQRSHLEYKCFMLHLFTELLRLLLAADFEMESENIMFLMNKLARRAFKLGSNPESTGVVRRAKEVAASAKTLLSRRWLEVQKASVRKIHWEPDTLNFQADTRLTLSKTLPYIKSRLAHHTTASKKRVDLPPCPNRLRRDFLPTILPGTIPIRFLITHENSSTAQKTIALYDFEKWVETDLKGWSGEIEDDKKAGCKQLQEAINVYGSLARKVYLDDPERISVMALTICELWGALDGLTISLFPILAEYSPVIPITLFEPLVLPKRAQMARLYLFETYLSSRLSAARPEYPSIFTSSVTYNSISVRAYQQSPEMMDCHRRILAEASGEKQRTLARFSQAKAQLVDLEAERDQHPTCECYYEDPTAKKKKKRGRVTCRRCQVQQQISRLNVTKFEWPLPENSPYTEAAVFELRIPQAFRYWRDATYAIITTHLSSVNPPQHTRTLYGFEVYPMLKDEMLPNGRIRWSSSSKPINNSHYGGKETQRIKRGTPESSVCFPHAMRYNLYCGTSEISFPSSDAMRDLCTPSIPNGPYKDIHSWIRGVSHTHNDVIASQSRCHPDLDIHEFISFGSLRAGERIQWMNILRELDETNLTFSVHEVCTLLNHAASQCGTRGSTFLREAHVDLKSEIFCDELLTAITSRLNSIADNWRERHCLHILSCLIRRILSTKGGVSNNIRVRSISLLKDIMKVARSWLVKLMDDAKAFATEGAVAAIQEIALHIALTGKLAFDVDSHFVEDILSTPGDMAYLIQFSSAACDFSSPSGGTSKPLYLVNMATSSLRLSLSLEDHLRQKIRSDSSILSTGIKTIWEGLPEPAIWNLKSAHPDWVEYINSSSPKDPVVHFNLLNGELLVDGAPVGRLPKSITETPVYQLLFGKRILDVFPSASNQGAFEAKHLIEGYRVSFHQIEARVIICASTEGATLELIPHGILKGDIPNNLIDDHLHWLHRESGEVQFRTVESPWTPAEGWVLKSSSDGYTLRNSQSAIQLIDTKSPTFRMVQKIFNVLEQSSDNLLVTISASNELSIALPRYELEFTLDNGKELRCSNFPGMTIDPSQDIGTLVGLQNILVLCSGSNSERERIVLVPRGEIGVKLVQHHTAVHISLSQEEKRIGYYHYRLDRFLNRFEDRVFSESWLFRVLLHVVTSSCLEDPFTHRTGVEFALSHLTSATAFSFKEIDSRSEMPLLQKIAELAPVRSHYPAHLRIMQNVDWRSDLTWFQQDPQFFECVADIVGFERQRSFLLHKEPNDMFLTTKDKTGDTRLRSRSSLCYKQIRRLGSVTESPNRDDRHHSNRHFFAVSSFRASVAQISARVHRRDACRLVKSDLVKLFEEWSELPAAQSHASVSFETSLMDISLPSQWLTFDSAIKSSSTYGALFFLSALAANAAHPVDIELLTTLLASRLDTRLQAYRVPTERFSPYRLAEGYVVKRSRIEGIVRRHAKLFIFTEELSSRKPPDIFLDDYETNCRMNYQHLLESEIASAINFYERNAAQWREVPLVSSLDHSRLDRSSLRQEMASYLGNCASNAELKAYAEKCSFVLRELRSSPGAVRDLLSFNCLWSQRLHSAPPSLTLNNAFRMCSAPHISSAPAHPQIQQSGFGPRQHGNRGSDIQDILSQLSSSRKEFKSQFLDEYIKDLKSSLESSMLLPHDESGKNTNTTSSQIVSTLEAAAAHARGALIELQIAASPYDDITSLTHHCGRWPVLDTLFWLQGLVREDVRSAMGDPWFQSMLCFARALSAWRRCHRIDHLHKLGRFDELRRELENVGEQGWSAAEAPEWLLFEIENNLTIRRVQAEIAKQMISPGTRENAVMQLNMGEGKTSVIIPLVAAAVANGEQLARVVVLGPLHTAMFQILAERLSSLSGRRIYHLPFSRSVRMDDDSIPKFQRLLETCRKERGVLVASPEHVLSFNLAGLEHLCRNSHKISKVLFQTQSWLASNVRDILDESDELLSVKYQLIYTIGQQQAVDGQPDRWTLIQQVLGLLRLKFVELAEEFPEWFECRKEPGHIFPIMRIRHDPRGWPDKILKGRLVDAVERGELPALSFRLFSSRQKSLAISFITDPDFPVDYEAELLEYLTRAQASVSTVLLLRGLLAHDLVIFAIKEKRWRVDYGRDARVHPRTRLAVPYRAKDKPDQRADFGHPDVALILTCLSYYYGGLTQEEIRICFSLLMKCEDPPSEYQGWIKHIFSQLPPALRQLNGVNLLDERQWAEEIVPSLRRCKAIVDFYLSRHIFPREAKEFPYKLTTNSWDLAQRRSCLTTGFSGTNDNRHLLPLSIEQQDLPDQRHTNALVLLNLLHEENDHVVCPNESNAKSIIGVAVAHHPPVRVLLDVGAQVLELNNRQVARNWLGQDRSEEIRAAIYFDHKDEAMVLMRNGRSEKLKASPMAKQLDACLVYLDEAHTRGIDLPLPAGTKALVTLGPKLVKDKLVQGCMRMRKLGNGHSLVFLCPPEIERQISRSKTGATDTIHVADILKWSMRQTCLQMESNAALWAQQGNNFLTRQEAFEKHGLDNSEELATTIREAEARSLQQLYSPSQQQVLDIKTDYSLLWMRKSACQLVDKCRLFGIKSLEAAGMQEEQEREVAQETEQERNEERLARASPATHNLHDELVHFVEGGALPATNAKSVIPAFDSFSRSSFHKDVAIAGWSSKLFCTRDFASTTSDLWTRQDDVYLRPVNWLLSTRDFSLMIILSPFEANRLLPKIRLSNHVRLHIYAPRVTQVMRSFDSLDRYHVGGDPEVLHGRPKGELIHALNIFAGQLYFEDEIAYKSICKHLALNISDQLDVRESSQIDVVTGFVHPSSRSTFGMADSPFLSSPVPAIRSVAAARKKGKPFQETHAGKLVRGVLLRPNDFNQIHSMS